MKRIAVPIIVLILLIGVVVPILNMIKSEFIQYHFDQFISSNAVQESNYSALKNEHLDSYKYLIQHPKTALKLSVNRLQHSEESSEKEILIGLNNDLLKSLRLEPIKNHEQWIHQFKTKQSKLYDELTKQE